MTKISNLKHNESEKILCIVIPAKAGIQSLDYPLGSGFHRSDRTVILYKTVKLFVSVIVY
jgi:hypothetical protein